MKLIRSYYLTHRVGISHTIIWDPKSPLYTFGVDIRIHFCYIFSTHDVALNVSGH